MDRLTYRVTCKVYSKVIDYLHEGKESPTEYLMKGNMTMYALRNITINKQQKKVQFFNKKKSGLVLMSLLDGMCRDRFI